MKPIVYNYVLLLCVITMCYVLCVITMCYNYVLLLVIRIERFIIV